MKRKTPHTHSSVTVDAYRDDPLYPRICRAVDQTLECGKVVAPIDVLVRMGLLSSKAFEDWRRGRVPYLERVVSGSLPRLSRLLRILRFHAHDLRLVPTPTVYVRTGKRPKQRLRFTKSGDRKLEEAYATSFRWPGKQPFHSRPAAEGKQAPVPNDVGEQPSTQSVG